MSDYLVGTESELGKSSESGLKRADELGFELTVDSVSCVCLFNVSANVCIEKKRVCDFVRINAGATNGNVDIKTDVSVNNPERNGVRSAELVINELLCIEIINSLILAGIAAVCKAFTDGFECIQYSLAEGACENAGFR